MAKILVVEDDAPARNAIRRLLSLEGHETLLAFNAPAAIRLLSDEKGIDVVLLDIMLGGPSDLTGWSVAAFMQSDERLRRVPILVISGLEPEQIREGATSYANVLTSAILILGKPIDADRLLKAIADLSRRAST